MRRAPSWEPDLAAYLSGWRGRPFAWGLADCGQLVAGALAVMAGVPVARVLEGARGYRSQYGALYTAQSLGVSGLEGKLRAIGLEDEPRGVAFAQRGDVIVADRAHALQALGVIWDREVWTTHPGYVCAPHPLGTLLSDALVLRMPG